MSVLMFCIGKSKYKMKYDIFQHTTHDNLIDVL